MAAVLKYFRLKKIHFTLFGIGLAAIAIRIFQLGKQSFWHDEILSILIVESSWSQIYKDSYIMTSISPFFYYLIKPFSYFNNTEFFTRIPSVFCALISIYLLYTIANKLFKKDVAISATFLLSMSSLHVWYSQEMRPYSMLLFLSLLSLNILIKIVYENKNGWWYFAFIVSTASIFYCHTLGIAFVGVLFFCALIFSPRENLVKWIATFAFIGLLILPVILELYLIPKLRSADSFRSFNVLSIPYTFWVFISGYSLGPSVAELHTQDSMKYLKNSLLFIVPTGSYFALLLFKGFFELKKNKSNFILIFLWISVPAVFALLGSFFSNQPFNARYVILVFPAIILLWAIAIASIGNKKIQLFSLGLYFLINIVSLSNLFFNPRYFKEDNRAASLFFKQHAAKADMVICSAFYAKKGLQYYTDHPESKLIGYRPNKMESRAGIITADLKEIIGTQQSFWLFLSRNYNQKQVDIIRKYCDKFFVRAIDEKFTGVELTFYKINKSHSTN
ncbi:MAG: hypothetical protein DWQ05_10965 [Calditrichaeota bacterium]|nr:MAG: hypothetical protein DWQ05_10965 [Calditrichota bacterium]